MKSAHINNINNIVSTDPVKPTIRKEDLFAKYGKSLFVDMQHALGHVEREFQNFDEIIYVRCNFLVCVLSNFDENLNEHNRFSAQEMDYLFRQYKLHTTLEEGWSYLMYVFFNQHKRKFDLSSETMDYLLERSDLSANNDYGFSVLWYALDGAIKDCDSNFLTPSQWDLLIQKGNPQQILENSQTSEEHTALLAHLVSCFNARKEKGLLDEAFLKIDTIEKNVNSTLIKI